jgi:outer membrane protein OmpA-like peptidoglycan-associated protein
MSLAACSGLPERIESLEAARTDVRTVAEERFAGRVAAEEIAAANDALARADRAYEEGEDLALIEHHAYVAQRYADIAGELVAEATAREEVSRAEAERNRLIAEARAREAATAQRELQSQTRAAEEQARLAEEQARIAEQQSEAAEAAAERNRQLQQELEQLQAESTDRGIVLTLGDVLFATGAATLNPGAAPTLDRLAQFMRDYPERSVRIEGHTDAVGSEDANLTLSERRANAVRDALVDRGLPPERIATRGYGETLPVATNDSPGGRQQNRRVEIVVSNERGSFGAADEGAREAPL